MGHKSFSTSALKSEKNCNLEKLAAHMHWLPQS